MKKYLNRSLNKQLTPGQFANFYAVEIAENIKECPTEKEIAAIERRLKKLEFHQLTTQLARNIVELFQDVPSLQLINKTEAAIDQFQMARFNTGELAKAA